MAMLEERVTRLEAERENEVEWRREMMTRLDRLEGNQRWIIGIMVLLHSVTIGAIFAAAALF